MVNIDYLFIFWIFIFNSYRFAYKFGFISDDDDQVDDDPIQYANFQYTKRQETPNIRISQPISPPPAYDYVSPDEQWLKGIRDKCWT